MAGDPVHLFTGRLTARYIDMWWHVHGSKLLFMRTYNSGSTYQGLLGVGWTHSYDRHVIDMGSQGVMEVDGRGLGTTFPPDGSGGFLSPSGRTVSIQHQSDGSWVVTYPTQRLFGYRPDGKLAYVQEPAGHRLTMEYDANNQLLRVVDSAGKALTFEVVDGLIRSVTAKNGVLKMQFAYTPDRHLAAAIDTRGKAFTYAYDPSSGDLSRITLPTGDRVDYVYRSSTDARVAQIITTSATGRVSQATIDYPDDHSRVFTDATGRTWNYLFDVSGREVQRTYPDGRVRTLVRDAAGHITQATDPSGTRSWSYDDRGQASAFTAASGRTTTVERNPTTGRPLAWVLPDGKRIEKSFDNAGALILQKDQLGRTTQFIRDARGLVLKSIDPAGRPTVNQFDDDGNLLQQTDALLQTTVYTRDDMGRIVQTRTPGGRVSKLEYDGMRLVSAEVDAASQRTTYEHDGLGRRTARTLPNGARWEYIWDRINGRDLLIQEKAPDGGTNRKQYDSSGNLIAETDPLGRTTTATLDGAGRVVRTDYPGGDFQLKRYNAVGLVSEIEDSAGAVTHFFYDADHRLTRTEYPDGSAMSTEFDPNGRVKNQVNPDGGVQQQTYDDSGQVIAAINPIGGISKTEYTLTGAVKRKVDPLGHATIFDRDALDRVLKTTDALTFSTQERYAPDGEVTQSINARGFAFLSRYDSLSRLIESVDPLSGSVKRSYNEVGDLLEAKDENQHSWKYEVDLLGRRVTQIDPHEASTRYVYDLAGELVQLTFPDGAKWRFRYDPRGRITARELVRPDGTLEDTETYGYDLRGNRLTAENAAVKVVSTYDIMQREVTRTTTYKKTGAVRELDFLWDIMGRRQLVRDSHGRMQKYEYDKLSRPTAITVLEPNPLATSAADAFFARAYRFVWDADSFLSAVDYPNGTHTRREPDALNRLARLTHERTTPTGADVLATWAIDRDENGNPTKVLRDGRQVWTFEHDPLDQLVKVELPRRLLKKLAQEHSEDARDVHGVGDDGDSDEDGRRVAAVTYHYDPAHNRDAVSLADRTITTAFGPANEVLRQGDTTFSYDLRGNQTERTFKRRREVYGYNVAGQLMSFSAGRPPEDHDRDDQPKPKIKEVERYLYSPDNERVLVEDVQGSRLTHALWDGHRQIDEFIRIGKGGDAREVGTLYGRDLGSQLLETASYERRTGITTHRCPVDDDDRDDSDRANGALAAASLRHVRWTHPDFLGSSSLVTNHRGQVLQRYQYGPWGERLEGDFAKLRFGYTGHSNDSATNDWGSKYRYLDPRAGRWTQRDPTEDIDGLNRYIYVADGPMSSIDTQGLYDISKECDCAAPQKKGGTSVPVSSPDNKARVRALKDKVYSHIVQLNADKKITFDAYRRLVFSFRRTLFSCAFDDKKNCDGKTGGFTSHGDAASIRNLIAMNRTLEQQHRPTILESSLCALAFKDDDFLEVTLFHELVHGAGGSEVDAYSVTEAAYGAGRAPYDPSYGAKKSPPFEVLGGGR